MRQIQYLDYNSFRRIIARYVGLWIDLPYVNSNIKLPSHMDFDTFIEKISDSQRNIYKSLDEQNLSLIHHQVEDYSRLMKSIVDEDRQNLEFFNAGFMRYLTETQRTEVNDCGSDDIKVKFQKVLNILFKDYYAIYHYNSVSQ